MSAHNKTIIYVNFSPYVNAGNILDYLLIKFPIVIVFCFNFYKLGNDQEPSKITIYKHKKIVSEFPLYQTPTPAALVFFLLPLRSLVIFIQIFFHSLRLQKTYGQFDYYFTVNAFSAWCGNVLRSCGAVKETIFWVWDYYPPKHSSTMVRIMRWLYWQFDKPATLSTNKVIFLNQRMAELRKSIGILPRDASTQSVGIATNPRTNSHTINDTNINLVFFGVVKKRHGLDLILDSANELHKKFKNLKLEIIGGGPDEHYYKERFIHVSLPVTFHGYVKKEAQVDDYIQHCDIGLAPYTNDESNVSQYTDPSKIKRYISNGLPVIATDVFEFSEVIKKHNAGIIIPYTQDALIRAVSEIVKRYKYYQLGSIKLGKKYSYKTFYDQIFA